MCSKAKTTSALHYAYHIYHALSRSGTAAKRTEGYFSCEPHPNAMSADVPRPWYLVRYEIKISCSWCLGRHADLQLDKRVDGSLRPPSRSSDRPRASNVPSRLEGQRQGSQSRR